MKLYRNLSAVELLVLLEEGVVKGRFDFENRDSDYRKEMGPVACMFPQPIEMDSPWFDYEFLLEVEVPEDDIVGKGVMRWNYKDGYDLVFAKTAEIYVRKYTLKNVTWIRSFDKWLIQDAFWAMNKLLRIKRDHPHAIMDFERENVWGEPRKPYDWDPKTVEDYIDFVKRAENDRYIQWELTEGMEEGWEKEHTNAVFRLLLHHLEFMKGIEPLKPFEFPGLTSGFEVRRRKTDIYY